MKLRYPALRINIAVGGWAFNDPPTSTLFSDMAGNIDNRRTFVDSVVDFLRTYGLDGIDIDWEYPGATDRGGQPDDTDRYVELVAELREAFDKEGVGWEISCAIPSSYWYLRGFNLESMQKYIDYFNLMSYDIYGVWDQENEWTGPYLQGHTDWSQIELGLDLLWRNGVKPENVVLGMGFYGRSFTMEDPNCFEPNGECRFSDGGMPGSCTDTVGVLAYYEINSRNSTLDVKIFYDAENTVKWNVFGGSQWVSYDDAQSWHDKKVRLSEHCLSGLMIWAIDQDTGDFDAMDQLFGDYSGLELDGLDHDSAEKLSDLFGQFTGQDCFVTERCTKDGDDEKGLEQVCPSGFQSCGSEFESCRTDNEILYGAISWRPSSTSVQLLECDEYPWAASEEGGNWKPENERSRLCVPRVQNNHGGQCVEMLSGLQSNVGQMEPIEPAKDKSRVDMWALWGKSSQQKIWYTEDDVGGVQNRLTTYDNSQPVPVGWTDASWRATGNGDRVSWVFKRNYTFDIVDDASDGVGLWDATDKRVINSRDTIRNANGFGSILCAVNIFGQDDYYKYPRDSDGREYNTLCYKLPMSTRMLLPPVCRG